MNLNDFLAKCPKTDPLSLPLGFNKDNVLISFNLAHHANFISFGDNYALLQSMTAYALLKNSSEDLKLIIYSEKDTTLSQFRNMPHVISYSNGSDVRGIFASIQWAIDEIERRKKSKKSHPRVLLAIYDANTFFWFTKPDNGNSRGQLYDMLKTISLYGARYGINLITDKNNFLWKEENDEFLGCFNAWLTPGGSFEESQYLTGDRYTFRDMRGSYYKLSGEKAEILQLVESNDYDILELMPNLESLKPHEYDKRIEQTKLEGPIAKTLEES